MLQSEPLDTGDKGSEKPEASRRLSKELERRLREFTGYQRDWDGYGAPPISPKAVSRAKSVIAQAPIRQKAPNPFVSPTRHGGIGMEWKLDDRKELLLEVSRDGGLSYLLVVRRPDGEEEETEGVVGSAEEFGELFTTPAAT